MNQTAVNIRRLPAEWEEQDAILVAWPHKNSDWEPVLELVEPVFANIVATISRFQKLILIEAETGSATAALNAAGANMERITRRAIPTNDTWARDFGPITVIENGRPLPLDFGFNGWGLKFPANLDNKVNQSLCNAPLFASPARTVGLVLEGGSIESDGKGTLLTTAECLLSPNRNPHLSKEEIEAFLCREFGTEHLLWLVNGYLAGDDTDSHIDTLARLAPDNTILYVECNDPADEHYEALTAMRGELEKFRTQSGNPYKLIPLPMPSPCYGPAGNRVPATYANFLIINDAVLVPTYSDRNDNSALAAVRQAFPSRNVIGIECSPLILQHGSLHCLTMQFPKGTLL
jgi:agmatine deiminase